MTAAWRWLACALPLLADVDTVAAAPIHDAAKQGDVAAIEAALITGANVDDSDGSATPLYYAATKGHLQAVELLVARGADVNLSTKWGPPLVNAAWNGNAAILKLLLARGADPNSAVKSETALHFASQSGSLECVELLVTAGADVNALTRFREPAIHFARKHGHEDIARYLLSHGYQTPKPAAVSARLATADAISGRALYVKECSRCHDPGPEQRRFRGPPLWNVVGRPTASVEGFKYSPVMTARGGSWTYETLNVFLSDPSRALPGNDMGSNGLQDDAERANLIAFLRTCSADPLPLPTE